MSGHEDNFYALLVFGFGAGLLSFFRGFRTYRKYRILEDTPEAPIRSIPMGLVQIHGKAMGEQQILSPVTHTPCFLYKVDIEKWKEDRNRGHWSKYRTDIQGVRFYLQDDSGKVLVDGRQAELDLAPVLRCEARGGSAYGVQTFSQTRVAPVAGIEATDDELLSYVTRVSTGSLLSFVERRIESSGVLSDPAKEMQRQTMTDFLKHPLDPDVMQRTMADVGQLSDPGREQARLTLMEALKHPVGSPEFEQGIERSAAAAQAGPEDVRKFRQHVQAWQRFRESGVTFNPPPAYGRYRFTEYCITPDQDYDVTGTCVENPNAKDEHDRNLIIKGQNEPTFLISYRSEEELERNLRSRAALMVFGGGAAAVVCLGILLAKLGWL